MAYLILSNKMPKLSDGNDWENFYEFDSNDKNAVHRIHQILAFRKNNDSIGSVKSLSAICEHTLKGNADKKNCFVSCLYKSALKYIWNSIGTAKTRRKHCKIPNKYSCDLCGAYFHSTSV